MGQKVQTQQNTNTNNQTNSKETSLNTNANSYPGLVNKNTGNNIFQSLNWYTSFIYFQ